MKKKFIWQDLLMMIAGFMFAPALVISIMAGISIPLATTIPTVAALLILTICQWTLKLKLTAFATLLTAVCWIILIF